MTNESQETTEAMVDTLSAEAAKCDARESCGPGLG